MAFWRRKPRPVQVVMDEETFEKFAADVRRMSKIVKEASDHMDLAFKTGIKEINRATEELKKARQAKPRTKITNH